ncbi:hypothetical protein FQR65_LT17936 [Abscondita terminalis]|nr:hypothetical protein FQR65_LT17936 [Abscondita terminalis]
MVPCCTSPCAAVTPALLPARRIKALVDTRHLMASGWDDGGATVFGLDRWGRPTAATPAQLIALPRRDGAGGATLLPGQGWPSVMALFPERASARGRPSASFAATFAAGFAIGPLMGWAAVANVTIGARWFLLNVPSYWPFCGCAGVAA